MAAPDRNKWIEAMDRELKEHYDRKHWVVIPKSQAATNKYTGTLTGTPVVSWATVRLVFILALVLQWEMHSIDFVMAYTQAEVKTPIFMELPKGTTLAGIDPSKHILQLKQNLYSLKDGQLTDEGELKDYLGIRFIHHPDGVVEMIQPKIIIDCCLEVVGLDKDDAKIHDSPAESTVLLHADTEGESRKQEWNYRAAIGCLNYIQAMTCPDLSYSVHQCARFCNNPRLLHEKAVKRICCYLHGTRDKGLHFKPEMTKGFQCYVDADWAKTWNKDCG